MSGSAFPTSFQTHTPYQFASLPSKEALLGEFRGKPLGSLRTPAIVIDRSVFAQNCAKMHSNAKEWGASFRAHVKTHKTAEGVRLQLKSSTGQTSAIVVSTLMEAWQVVQAGLVADGTVKDILYGLPVAPNKIADLADLRDELARYNAVVRVLVDNPGQVRHLEQFEDGRDTPQLWSVFIKVDAGGKRAGLEPTSPYFETLLTSVFTSTVISVYGFYTHAGQSYASTSLPEASSFLSAEVDAVNTAAGFALSLLAGTPDVAPRNTPFVLAVGSTPTAHAATAETREKLASLLNGTLELHAGNYPLLDLQQLHTGLVNQRRVAQRVLATIISYYPGRGVEGTDEAMCDAGAIAMSKDTGPSGTFGEIVGTGWRLGRISQEHGTLVQNLASQQSLTKLNVGDLVQIVGQHACLTLAAYPWYYVVDSEGEGVGLVVEDVWVPWKGW
ncbi:putative serine dehydratase domain-containing protein [Irpex rosettiformis]|uniref:Serine dehydratase domain-containing protein n=1 Tax=Irpex rosettiformis TaxID=378272 RepID=A0ACB8UKH1_9APHY|nr:putative serine dehydratase domain-containing protein [Irpex rosettiformis]